MQADPADQRRGSVTEWGLAAAMAALAHPLAVVGAAVAAVALWAFGVGFLSGPVLGFGLASLLGAISGGGGLPGHALRPEAEPALASLVVEVARRVGFAEPLLVRAVPVPDAALATVRVQGVRARVMLLGLPLLRRLSEAELAGVVAHELAHDARAHDRRTTALLLGRAALADSLERSVHVPPSWAAHLLRATRRAWAARARRRRDGRDCRRYDPGTRRPAPGRTARGRLPRPGRPWVAALGDDRYPADLYDALDEAAYDQAIAARMAQVADEVDEEDPIGASSHPPVAARVAALPDAIDRGRPPRSRSTWWGRGSSPTGALGRSPAPTPCHRRSPVQGHRNRAGAHRPARRARSCRRPRRWSSTLAATGGAHALGCVEAACAAIADDRWLEVAARVGPGRRRARASRAHGSRTCARASPSSRPGGGGPAARPRLGPRLAVVGVGPARAGRGDGRPAGARRPVGARR